jgi:hypothetical protein
LKSGATPPSRTGCALAARAASISRSAHARAPPARCTWSIKAGVGP